jgi:hypothetical protein
VPIKGQFFSANVGNFLPQKANFTYSLADPQLARLIHNQVKALDPDICVFQEIWTFTEEVLGSDYEILGQNDCIAVKRDFGIIVPNSFRSHSIRFKKSENDPALPAFDDEKAQDEQKKLLQEIPYDGKKYSQYGIPADFDVTSAIIEEKITKQRFLIVNVHVQSAPWKDKSRARQLREWILEESITRANQECKGRILIAGDFNHDEDRQPNTESTAVIQAIMQIPNMHDASGNNHEVTTKLPRIIKNYRYDHIFGTASFSNFRVLEALTENDYRAFKKAHRVTHWAHLDHKSLFTKFLFL